MLREIDTGNGKIVTYWDGTDWKGKSIWEETEAYFEAYKKKYPQRQLQDKKSVYGEFFAIRYISQLKKTTSQIEIWKVCDPVEGKDSMSFNILGENGNIEIKTINNFLTRNNNSYTSPDPGGSIQFEIFHKWIQNNYDQMYAGWLLSAYNYPTYNQIKKEHNRDESAETPGLYIFVLTTTDGTPYACIAFENIPELLKRLLLICPDSEKWGMPNPRTLTPARDREYWEQFYAGEHYDSRYGGMIQNCWLVPFESICDLATVTMIDNIDLRKEWEKGEYKCGYGITEARYKKLQSIADRDGRGEHFYPNSYRQEENKKIESRLSSGAKVSKRQQINLSDKEYRELQKGKVVARKGEQKDIDPAEREKMKELVTDFFKKESKLSC